MKDLRLVGLVAGILLVFTGVIYAQGKGPENETSKFLQQQRQGNMDFQKSLKGMTPAQRKSATAAYFQKRESENKAFMDKRHAEDMALLRKRLDNNKKMSAADKQKLIDSMEKQYQENAAFRESLKGMTPEQRRKAIEARRAKLQAEEKARIKAHGK
jgi:hypothetical protein